MRFDGDTRARRIDRYSTEQLGVPCGIPPAYSPVSTERATWCSFRGVEWGVANWKEPTTILRIVCDGFGNLVQNTLDRRIVRATFGLSFLYVVLHHRHVHTKLPDFPYEVRETLWNKTGGYRGSKSTFNCGSGQNRAERLNCGERAGRVLSTPAGQRFSGTSDVTSGYLSRLGYSRTLGARCWAERATVFVDPPHPLRSSWSQKEGLDSNRRPSCRLFELELLVRRYSKSKPSPLVKLRTWIQAICLREKWRARYTVPGDHRVCFIYSRRAQRSSW